MTIQLKTFPDTESLIFQCLELFRSLFPTIGKNQQALTQSVPMLGKTDGVMLAGGRTPLEIYRRAAAEGLSTDATLFLSDERYVPVTDPQSNHGGIAPFFNYSLVKVNTELPIEEAAQAFHEDLSQVDRIPLGLLGLGADGHTASLFNLQDAALRDERLAIPVHVEEASSLFKKRQDAASTFTSQRISVTPALLNRIERIIIIATGEEKIEMIQTLLNEPETIPAGVALADHPNVEIWTDQSIG